MKPSILLFLVLVLPVLGAAQQIVRMGFTSSSGSARGQNINMVYYFDDFIAGSVSAGDITLTAGFLVPRPGRLTNIITPTKSLIRIFPNPFEQQFHVLTNEISVECLEIYDLNGRLIKREFPRQPDFMVDGATIPSGLFFIKMLTSGNQYYTNFLIKK